MKILLISDSEQKELWERWNSKQSEKLSDVGLILSAGDLNPGYLEFLVTMLNVPLLYVRGNHDSCYDEKPPEGCLDIDGRVQYVECRKDGSCRIIYDEPSLLKRIWNRLTGKKRRDADSTDGSRMIKIAGLGGSMRYRPGPDMYTEKEMAKRVVRLMFKIKSSQAFDKRSMMCSLKDSAGPGTKHEVGDMLDILLTHSPSRGHGDMEDMPHTGYRCFNDFINEIRPGYHCYGHIHMDYGRFDRESVHPSGTKLINASGMYILEL